MDHRTPAIRARGKLCLFNPSHCLRAAAARLPHSGPPSARSASTRPCVWSCRALPGASASSSPRWPVSARPTSSTWR
nr:MAG TPA: hypothetical protein [Caudoviricetes sp.]